MLDGRGSRLGVSIRDVNEDDVKAGRTTGVVIEDVNDDSPAAKGGFKAGDVVTSFDGERVRSARQFSRLVEETPSGRSVKAQVMRGGAAGRPHGDAAGAGADALRRRTCPATVRVLPGPEEATRSSGAATSRVRARASATRARCARPPRVARRCG